MEITGYKNYLIYDDGRVYSKTTKRFLKSFIDRTGYEIVDLYKNSKRKHYRVHRLIAEHYLPNPDKKLYVDHINRIRKDNRVENLRWATNSENQINIACYGKSKEKHIYKYTSGYGVKIVRNSLLYYKYCKTKEEAIKQRDLMLSMF